MYMFTLWDKFDAAVGQPLLTRQSYEDMYYLTRDLSDAFV